MANQLSPAWNAALDDYPTALACSRDGAVVAAGTASGKLFIFDASSGDLLHTLAAHTNGVLALAFGRQHLASAGQDGHARLWDFRAGTQVAALPGKASWVQHLTWTPDGKRLASAGGKTAQLWDASGALLKTFVAPNGGINALAWNAVGGLLATIAGAELHLWRAGDGGLDRSLKWKSTLLNGAWSPDGKVLASGSIDKSIHFWRAGSWLDSQMGGYGRKPQALVWSADSKLLATTGEDRIIVWSFSGKGPEGSKPLELYGHVTPPELLAAHPKKSWLLSAAKEKTLLLWNPKSGEKPVGDAVVNTEPSALAFNPGAALAYAADSSGHLFAYWINES